MKMWKKELMMLDYEGLFHWLLCCLQLAFLQLEQGKNAGLKAKLLFFMFNSPLKYCYQYSQHRFKSSSRTYTLIMSNVHMKKAVFLVNTWELQKKRKNKLYSFMNIQRWLPMLEPLPHASQCLLSNRFLRNRTVVKALPWEM